MTTPSFYSIYHDNATFCWELDFSNQPKPKLYYGYDVLPKLHKGERVLTVKLRNDDPRDLRALERLYPYVPKKESIDNHATDAVAYKPKQENKMPEAVTGFMTNQGKFCDTEEEARLYEARYNLTAITTSAARSIGIQDDDHLKEAVEQIIQFINVYQDEITEYLHARRAFDVQETSQKADVVDRQATTDNSSDDPSVRSSCDISVDEDAPTEADPKSSGKKTK